jgi:hypothetical protein
MMSGVARDVRTSAGLIEQAGPATYQLDWRVYQLAQSAQAGNGMLPIAEPWMRRLVAQTDETVTLLQVAGAEMRCIGQVEPTHMVRITMEPGQLSVIPRRAIRPASWSIDSPCHNGNVRALSAPPAPRLAPLPGA